MLQEETFAPIIYPIKNSTIEEAIRLNNQVLHSLSSCIFTENFAETETFLSETDSDCCIANVNHGISSVEIVGVLW